MGEHPAVVTHRLRKEYDSVLALKALDIEIAQGEIFGLIGPNGAGKSTLLNILATTIRPDYGNASLAGFDVEKNPHEVRRRTGFMPDFFALYENVTVEDFLTYFALAFDVDHKSIPGQVDRLLNAVNLTEKRRADISQLSRGMRQRLVFAKTLVHDPDVLLLDEPLSGLDPKARMEMREVMREISSRGKTVIISSHILAELSDFCTSIGILEKGVLRICGSIDEILARMKSGRMVTLEVSGDAAKARELIQSHPSAETVPGDGDVIKFTLSGERNVIAEINASLVKAGVGVLSIREERGNLEEIYLNTAAHEVQ